MSFSPTALGELLRRHYPRAKGLIQQAIEAIQMSKTQGVKLTDIDVFNKVIPIRSKVKVIETIDNAQMNVSGGYPTYIPATEPNGTSVKLYLFMDHIAHTYRDHSGFDHHGELQYDSGSPDVDTDGLDLGNGFASRALHYDSDNGMVVVVQDHADLKIAGLTTGFSLVIRAKFDSISNQAGTGRRLWAKFDDTSNNICILMDSTGKIEVHIEIGGVTTRWETTSNVITAIDTWYTIGIVFTVAGPALAIYVRQDGTAMGAAHALTTGISSRSMFDETTNLLIGGFDEGAWGRFDGNDFVSQADSAALDLSVFSVAARFRTSVGTGNERCIVVKGGLGSETAGENMNYGIYFNQFCKVVAGFEDSGGTDRFVTSPKKYNDGMWHYAVCTYSGGVVRLYIDGVQVASLSTGLTPETNTHPLVTGRNSRASDRFWIGDIDEVRVWNTVLNQTDVTNLLSDTVQQTGLVYENTFGGTGFHGGGLMDGNIQFVLYDRNVLWSATEMAAIHTNKWTKNPSVGSNKVAMSFYTLATTA